MKCPKCGFAMLDNWVHYKGALECVLECESCEHTVPYTHPLVRDALAASRRALTMAEDNLPRVKWRDTRDIAVLRAIKAARTAMDKAQGRATP